MKPSVKTLKRKFDRELKHIKLILTHERRRVPVKEWLDLVMKTKECILSEPENFFGKDLPPKALFHEALDMVFEAFLEDQRLLVSQISKGFRIPSGFKSKS